MRVSARVQVAGPLAVFVEGFAAELSSQGYTDLSLANQLRLMADLSRWLKAGQRRLEELTREVVDQFLAKRRRTHTQFVTYRAVAPLLDYLAARGAMPPLARAPTRSALVLEYERYLAEDVGVSELTVSGRLQVAESFLRGRLATELTAADVTRFAKAHADEKPGFSTWLTALRSLLRFLFLRGETPRNLVYAVPSMPCWRSSLPKALTRAEVAAVLATCDRRTTIGRRDYAALLLMVRLGLRAGEVASILLDDIDWLAGELVVHGKGRTLDRLPLPTDVGEALVGFLQRRPRMALTRHVFLRSRAPYRGGTPAMISALAASALRAAGVPYGAAHRLRHTAATQMLHAGASLTQIAQVLRHRHVDTTAIYAKVDRGRLHALARPWPAGEVSHTRLRALAQRWPGGAA